MKRRCLAFHIGDHDLVATMHEPTPSSSTSARRGFVMLNAGPAPRAGNSDLSARLCDRVASMGMPSFRVDFVGLGDSSGASWKDIGQYQHANESGVNALQLAVLIDELCERHALDSLYIGGLCAGATSALSAVTSRGERVAGLVLFEPELRRSHTPTSLSGSSVGPRRVHATLWAKLHDPERLLARCATLLGRWRLAKPFARAFSAWLARRSEHHLPPDALVWAAEAWSDALDRGIPVRSIVAQDDVSDLYLGRIGRAQKFGRSAHHQITRLPGVNHLLTSEGAADAAIEATADWLRATETARTQ